MWKRVRRTNRTCTPAPCPPPASEALNSVPLHYLSTFLGTASPDPAVDYTVQLQAALDFAAGATLTCDLTPGSVVGISDTVFVSSNTTLLWDPNVTLKARDDFQKFVYGTLDTPRQTKEALVANRRSRLGWERGLRLAKVGDVQYLPDPKWWAGYVTDNAGNGAWYVDSGIAVYDLVIDGNAEKTHRTTGAAAGRYRDWGSWGMCTDAKGVAVSCDIGGVTLVGAPPELGRFYNEFNHGLRFDAVDGLSLHRCIVRHVHGDGILVGGLSLDDDFATSAGLPSRSVLLEDCHTEYTFRNGFAFTEVSGGTLRRCTARQWQGPAGFDVEPDLLFGNPLRVDDRFLPILAEDCTFDTGRRYGVAIGANDLRRIGANRVLFPSVTLRRCTVKNVSSVPFKVTTKLDPLTEKVLWKEYGVGVVVSTAMNGLSLEDCVVYNCFLNALALIGASSVSVSGGFYAHATQTELCQRSLSDPQPEPPGLGFLIEDVSAIVAPVADGPRRGNLIAFRRRSVAVGEVVLSGVIVRSGSPGATNAPPIGPLPNGRPADMLDPDNSGARTCVRWQVSGGLLRVVGGRMEFGTHTRRTAVLCEAGTLRMETGAPNLVGLISANSPPYTALLTISKYGPMNAWLNTCQVQNAGRGFVLHLSSSDTDVDGSPSYTGAYTVGASNTFVNVPPNATIIYLP